MSKQESYMDGMLRHLGAAYYDSLHGRAAPADVARAIDTLAEHIGEEPGLHPAKPTRTGAHPPGSRPHHHGRWRTRMRDVMTTSVVTVDRITPYKEIAALLAEHRISGVPVLSMGRKVTGIVSETDLLAARTGRITATGHRVLPWPSGHKSHQGLTAAQLMTSPPVTIHPDASVTMPVTLRPMLSTGTPLMRCPVSRAAISLYGVSRSTVTTEVVITSRIRVRHRPW